MGKAIDTPELMWEYFIEYMIDVAQRPILVHDFVGKDGRPVWREKQRPITVEGFTVFCSKHHNVWIVHYLNNSYGNYDKFLDVAERIRNHIRCDQIEGGLAGIYNPNITNRLNNLVDKTQTEFKVEQPLFLDEGAKPKQIDNVQEDDSGK